MEIDIKEVLKMIFKKDSENLILKMVIFTREISKTIENTVRGNLSNIKDMCMMEITRTV